MPLLKAFFCALKFGRGIYQQIFELCIPKPRERRKNCKGAHTLSSEEKRKVETKKMLVTDGAVSEDMPLKQGLPLQQTKFKSNGYEEEGNETIDVAILTNTSP